MMVVAAICWSTGGLLVRKLSITNAWEIVFWRSLFMAVFVALVLVVMHGRSMPRAVRGVGVPGLAGRPAARRHVLLLHRLAHPHHGRQHVRADERVAVPRGDRRAGRAARARATRAPGSRWRSRSRASSSCSAARPTPGQLAGNLLALGVSVCFAAQLTVLRKFHATVDMLPMVMIAGLWSLVPAFALAGPFAAPRARSGRAGAHGLRAARRRAACSPPRRRARCRRPSSACSPCSSRSSDRSGCGCCWASIPGAYALVGGALVLSRRHRQPGAARRGAGAHERGRPSRCPGRSSLIRRVVRRERRCATSRVRPLRQYVGRSRHAGFTDSAGRAINASGRGRRHRLQRQCWPDQGFIYRDGVMSPIDPSPSRSSRVLGINAYGQAVGSSGRWDPALPELRDGVSIGPAAAPSTSARWAAP